VLKPKLMLDRARPDGLLTSGPDEIKRDIVDWPRSERDGFVFASVNSVVNAFHIRSLEQMSVLASATGRDEEAAQLLARAGASRQAFQRAFFDSARGMYVDGEGTDHASLHANLFALAFDLVPPACRERVLAHVLSRGMACSVYAAQYLLEALFDNGADAAALALMTAAGDRSWRHMVESGTTITWEAWDQHYKPNQDWNHAWGAAPANLLPRFVLGVQPFAPGWTRVMIRPNPGPLKSVEGKVPTPLGPVLVQWENGGAFKLSLTLPPDMAAQVQLPAGKNSTGVYLGGQSVRARRDGSWWILDQAVTGTAVLETR